MEEKELQELEGALARAYPGPWHSQGITLLDVEWDALGEIWAKDVAGNANLDLVLAARNSLPSMISDLREARRLLGEARDHLRSEHQCASNEPTDIDAFLGERHGKD